VAFITIIEIICLELKQPDLFIAIELQLKVWLKFTIEGQLTFIVELFL
jgi:hypothetical protein